MKCEFCHREATTKITTLMNHEIFQVCDFCEEEVLYSEVQEFKGPKEELYKYFPHVDRILS